MGNRLAIRDAPLNLDHRPSPLSVDPEQINRATLHANLPPYDYQPFLEKSGVFSDPLLKIALKGDAMLTWPPRYSTPRGMG